MLGAALLASCATAPPVPPPRGLSPTAQAPSSRPAEAPRGQTSARITSFLAAEEWTEFSKSVLWPREWALRHWHRFLVTSGSVSLVPVDSLPPAPAVRAVPAGTDPAVWKLEWTGNNQGNAPTAQIRVVAVPVSEAGGVPTAVEAVRRAVLGTGLSRGEVRVSDEVLQGQSILVTVEFR